MWDVASNPYGDYDWYSSYEFDYEFFQAFYEQLKEAYEQLIEQEITDIHGTNLKDGINVTDLNDNNLTGKRNMFLRQLEDAEMNGEIEKTLKLIKNCTLNMDAYQRPESCGVSKTNLQKASFYTQESFLLTSSFSKSLDSPK